MQQHCRDVGVAWQHVKVMSLSAAPESEVRMYVGRTGGMYVYSKKLGKYFAGLLWKGVHISPVTEVDI